MTIEAPAAEPTAADQAANAVKPDKTKKVKEPKVAKEKKPRAESLWSTLQKAFARNLSYDSILKIVAEKHPTSKFNVNSVLHYNYYRAKYNMAAGKSEGEGKFEPTTSVGPVKEPKAAKPKAEKKTKAAPEAPAEA